MTGTEQCKRKKMKGGTRRSNSRSREREVEVEENEWKTRKEGMEQETMEETGSADGGKEQRQKMNEKRGSNEEGRENR